MKKLKVWFNVVLQIYVQYKLKKYGMPYLTIEEVKKLVERYETDKEEKNERKL